MPYKKLIKTFLDNIWPSFGQVKYCGLFWSRINLFCANRTFSTIHTDRGVQVIWVRGGRARFWGFAPPLGPQGGGAKKNFARSAKNFQAFNPHTAKSEEYKRPLKRLFPHFLELEFYKKPIILHKNRQNADPCARKTQFYL